MDLPQPDMPKRDLSGSLWGDYQVLRRLGSGGMADVYLARQASLSRQVALKVLHVQLADDASYVERFANEARAAASLVHPNIVQIYEVGRAEGFHFIAQEYVAGKNLAQVMEREGALQPGLVVDILCQIVSALCKADELKIVHRDLKPENILLGRSGEVKVADFGLARIQNANTKTLTQVGVSMGTPLYMSPEQIEGRPVDARSDIYSLGVTCYHLLAGTPPHSGESALAIAVQHLNSAAQPLQSIREDLPPALTQIVHQMLCKEPEQRPANPAILLNELRNLATDAVEQGWAKGPDHRSLTEWIASADSRSETAAQLGELMRANTRLHLGRSSWKWWTVGLVAAALFGVALAAVIQPKANLEQAQPTQVPTRPTAAAQLYHAKIADSEAAWRAVWEKFPQADPFLHQLARQGLVRYDLLVSQEYANALKLLAELEPLSASDDSLETLRAFYFASLTICHERMGDEAKAREAQAMLTSDMRDYLSRVETQLDAMLKNSLRTLGE